MCSLRVPTAVKLARVFKVSLGQLTIPDTIDGTRGELAGRVRALRLMLGPEFERQYLPSLAPQGLQGTKG
ncbi:hypothetical protein [Desulfofundulus thermocisternus]|uniref:hypothetical protein n=1 Tax=Desulfofundulus thermocisternus TaxID=42471 RepID=UPI0035C6A442